MGQSVEFSYYDTELSLTVTGVVAAPPSNSHFSFDFIVPMATDEGHAHGLAENRWGSNSWYTYAKLKPGADPIDFAERVAELGHRHLSDAEWYRDNPDRRTDYYPQALTDIHLRSHINFEIAPTGDIRYVLLFGLIALAILFTASVNYMNLSTARASTRAKEIGIRKASGADRSQLMGQFLGESVVVTLFALVLAVAFVALTQGLFQTLVGREIPGRLLFDAKAIGGGLLIGMFVGVLSGSYPALVMWRFRPVDVLKGNVPRPGGRPTLRNGLVVVQFSVGVILIFATIVVGRQLNFMGTAETGIERDQVVAIRVRDRWPALSGELSAVPAVLAVSSSSSLPTQINSQNGVEDWTAHEEGQSLPIYTAFVNFGYEDLLGLELVEGRGFSEEFADERVGLLINETARKALGWETAVGKTIDLDDRGTEVVGVLKDFHFHSFRQEIAPLALGLRTSRITRILLKIGPEAMPETIAGIGGVMERFSPDYPFEYEFLDDAYDQMYQSDRQLGSIFRAFTAIALLIACLGLFGMAAFMAQLRTKEIGVRKVLGASLGSIMVMMSRDLGRLVVVAVFIGGPLAYFGMQRWLDGFAYRIEPGWSVFAMTAGSALLVAWLTVAWQSFRAALTDPVRSLRQE
ncbi:MAG: putative ABC transport system permease protein [Rhodothermales bacterium]|jgi:putative ABC transport system permease protein